MRPSDSGASLWGQRSSCTTQLQSAAARRSTHCAGMSSCACHEDERTSTCASQPAIMVYTVHCNSMARDKGCSQSWFPPIKTDGCKADWPRNRLLQAFSSVLRGNAGESELQRYPHARLVCVYNLEPTSFALIGTSQECACPVRQSCAETIRALLP